MEVNWSTPAYIYDELNAEFHFTFDPCPLHSTFDGLTIEWKESNFINPPYDRKTKEAFIHKAFEQSRKDRLCVMLLPVSTSTKIFHDVILPNADIRFLRGRVKFVGEHVSNKCGMFDSMVVVFR